MQDAVAIPVPRPGARSRDTAPRALQLDELYDRYGIERFSLHDRGYIASRHPLELWMVSFLARNPDASLEQAIAASTTERQAVYRWLHRRSTQSRNTRMRTLLEIDAFGVIHRQWARLGYPFDELVPSYATSIGVSGDNPPALAELIGIVVNGGVRQPAVRVETLHFARGTPYETLFSKNAGGERVLHPAVAAALRAALADVVAGGTARRARGAYVDASAPSLSIGGKTGTGDNRYRSFGPDGALTGTKSVSRTATFAFFLGERHFGVIGAYVPAPYAHAHRFTSALPVQVLSNMAPLLLPYVSEEATRRCGAAAAVESAESSGSDPG